MVVFTRCRCLSNWIQLGCLIGLAACLGCGSKIPETAPGHAEYMSGRQLLADGKLAEAGAAFDQAIAINPQNALAVFYRANAHERLGNTDLAISGYAEAIRLHKQVAGMDHVQPESRPIPLGGELAQTYFSLATLLNKAGKSDEAIEDFTEALRVDPKHADAYGSRGAAFLAKGFAELAIDDLTEAIRLAPGSHEAICQRARAWLATGKYTEAIEDARLAIRLDAKCGDAFRTLGSAFLRCPRSRADRAIEYFKQAIYLNKNLATEVNPELAEAYFNCGVNLDKVGKKLEAEKAFGEAGRLDHLKYVKLRNEHKAKTDLVGNGPRSHTTFKIDLSDPKLQEKLNPSESASLKQERFDKALGEFTDILGMDANRPDAWYGRGFVFLEKGFPDSAIQDFDRAIRFAPDSAEAYCQRGRAYTQMGDYRRAIQDTTEAIRLKPNFALAYFHRANAYLNDNHFDRALADLDEAVRLDPELAVQTPPSFAEVYHSQGVNFIASQRWDKAIVSLEKAIAFKKSMTEQLAPQLAQAYRERGFDRANHNEFDEAIRDLKNAFELEKDNAQNYRLCGLTCCKMAQACHDRGLTADEKKQWEAAIDHLKRAIRLNPELKRILSHPLEEAKRNLDAISPPIKVTQHTGL